MRVILVLLCVIKFVLGKNGTKSRYGIIPKPGEFPFALCIHGGARCSGVLVKPDMFMTAGHCFENSAGITNLSDHVVIMGVIDIRNKDDPLYQERTIVKYKLHKDFKPKKDPTYYNDQAAGFLNEPMEMSETVGVAKLVSTDPEKFKAAWYEIVEKKEHCRGMGYGRTFVNPPSDKNRVRSNELRYIWLIPWPDQNCTDTTRSDQVDMCGKGEVACEPVEPDESLLVGDSGGPLMCGEYVYGTVKSGLEFETPIVNQFVLFFPYIQFFGLDASTQILANTYVIVTLIIFLLY